MMVFRQKILWRKWELETQGQQISFQRQTYTATLKTLELGSINFGIISVDDWQQEVAVPSIHLVTKGEQNERNWQQSSRKEQSLLYSFWFVPRQYYCTIVY